MIILGIETSCDETAASVLKEKNGQFFVLSNIISSQIKLHNRWGGVVPNLAAREHLKNIVPVIKKALKKSKISSKKIDLISVTNGPGLIPALLMGTSAAKTLSYSWQKPLIGIHHVEGHIYANFIDSPHPTLSLQRRGTNREVNKIKFPILCLVVSGGHTQLVYMKSHLNYEIVGQTLDDAAGEAFDKVARILGLGYPGGPAIAVATEREAQNVKRKTKIDLARYALRDIQFPRPMINSKDFNFSFSGLKTAVLYKVKKLKTISHKQKSEICHEFQQAVVDVLIHKTITAAKKYKPKTICIAGGVSANTELRCQLGEVIKREFKNILYITPDTLYSLDNATMIAVAAYFRYKKNQKNKAFQKEIENNWKNLKTDANLKLN